MVWEKVFLGRIMKYHIEFSHLFCQRLLRPVNVTFLKLIHKTQISNPPEAASYRDSTKYWSFYPSEPFTFTRFTMRHPVPLVFLEMLNVYFLDEIMQKKEWFPSGPKEGVRRAFHKAGNTAKNVPISEFQKHLQPRTNSTCQSKLKHKCLPWDTLPCNRIDPSVN